MDSQLNDLVLKVETRTRQLIMQHKRLQEELAGVRQQLHEHEEEMLALQIKNEELQNQYDHLKMAKYIDMADDDIKDMRGRIRKMVRDIDRCIAMIKVD